MYKYQGARFLIFRCLLKLFYFTLSDLLYSAEITNAMALHSSYKRRHGQKNFKILNKLASAIFFSLRHFSIFMENFILFYLIKSVERYVYAIFHFFFFNLSSRRLLWVRITANEKRLGWIYIYTFKVYPVDGL